MIERGLRGRVAIVTGATQTMGETIAARLAAEGAIVVGVGRSAERGESVAERIRSSGGDATFRRCDVSIEDDVAAVVEGIVHDHGRIDIVVNNAAAFDNRESAIHDESTETFDAIIKVGLYAPFWFAKYAVPAMIAQGSGVFVNISSYVSQLGLAGLPAYSASKGGLEALTRQMAAEYADGGVRANALVLGSITVPRNEALHTDPERSGALRRARMVSQPGTPDDVAGAVAFLASDDAKFITGACINLDGGLLAKSPVITTMQALHAEKFGLAAGRVG